MDLQSPHRIVGIATQGRSDLDQWVTSYKVMCSADGTTFNPVEEICNTSGNDTIFQGNVDRNTVVYNALPRPQNCQSVRVAPLTYHQYTCLRLEVYEQTPGVPDDVVPLGMESGAIPDSSLDVSGSTGELPGTIWRLNRSDVLLTAVLEQAGVYQWIQVDLLTQLRVVGIATQGSIPDIGSWVMSYKVSYGTDGEAALPAIRRMKPPIW
ncbi:EGF-like repeat and discoidin I-like domain-containing protein 3 [Diadema antillarum]|uniref:EGF-like repeat and discoidin I-like domain-containing protein 3 n=1 Tax=Diadema antillarum TaxID=105358 RepID=UPI003A890875